MNVLLFAYVVNSGSRRYAVLTAAGIIVSGVLYDAIAPLFPFWGGTSYSARCGAVSLQAWDSAWSFAVATPAGPISCSAHSEKDWRVRWKHGDWRSTAPFVALSAPVFSVENALYAAVAMYICGRVIDAVVDVRVQRAAYIISEKHEKSPARYWWSLVELHGVRGKGHGAASCDPSSSACSPAAKLRTSGDRCGDRSQCHRGHRRGAARGLWRGLRASTSDSHERPRD